MSEFILDIEQIRKSARIQMEKGAVTANYQADQKAILKILDSALATEWVCVLRYTQHAKSAQGLHAEPVAKHFFAHAKQEEDHANQLADRIKQLGGKPDLDPSSFARRSHTHYAESESLIDMIKENLVAERIAVDAYSAAIRFIGTTDPTTRRILESILQVEEEHADELADLLTAFDPREPMN